MSATYPNLIREEPYGYITNVAGAMLRDGAVDPQVLPSMAADDATRWCKRYRLVMVDGPHVDGPMDNLMFDEVVFRVRFRATGLPPEERWQPRRRRSPIWWIKRQARRVVGR